MKKSPIDRVVTQKIRSFSRNGTMAFSLEEFYARFPDPKCYLTGVKIDLSNARSYSLDHIIPYSRGGSCSIDNVELILPVINIMKSSIPAGDFVLMCNLVVKNSMPKIPKSPAKFNKVLADILDKNFRPRKILP